MYSTAACGYEILYEYINVEGLIPIGNKSAGASIFRTAHGWLKIPNIHDDYGPNFQLHKKRIPRVQEDFLQEMRY